MKTQFDFLDVTFTVDYVKRKGDKGDWEQPPYPDSYEIINVSIFKQDAMLLIEPHFEIFDESFNQYMTEND